MRVQQKTALGRVAAGIGILLTAAIGLSACTTGPDIPSFFGNRTKAKDPAAEAAAKAAADAKYCPPLIIRAETEAMTVYDRGHTGDADFVKYQASIDKHDRQCTLADGTLSVKVGSAGRIVGGPKGGAASLSLPVRIVVVHQTGGKPLFTKLYKVPASLTAPDLRSEWTMIEDISVTVGPEDRDLIVYVGFDEGKKAPVSTSAID